MSKAGETKTCVSCGRVMTWRKKWEKNWDEVRYCSDACRRAKPDETDRQIELTILKLLAKRAGGATICPSEVARAMFPVNWEKEMETVRKAARRLVASGEILVTQSGKVVDPSTARGPIRLRKV